MSEKHPQSTETLVHRLRRVATALDAEARNHLDEGVRAMWRARANTCLQAAGRLQDYWDASGREPRG